MQDQLRFSVRSSSGNRIYKLVACKTAQGLRFSCTCPDRNSTLCKHRIRLLAGDTTQLEGGSMDDLDALQVLFREAGVVDRLAAISKLEGYVRTAEVMIKHLKHQIATLMDN